MIQWQLTVESLLQARGCGSQILTASPSNGRVVLGLKPERGHGEYVDQSIFRKKK